MSENFHGTPSDSNRTSGFQCAGAPDASQGSDCCDDGEQWVRLMCQSICQMCCLTCSLGPIKVNGDGGPVPPDDETGTPSVTPGTYPTVTPVDGELQFTDAISRSIEKQEDFS